jgi:hypothetical protein
MDKIKMFNIWCMGTIFVSIIISFTDIPSVHSTCEIAGPFALCFSFISFMMAHAVFHLVSKPQSKKWDWWNWCCFFSTICFFLAISLLPLLGKTWMCLERVGNFMHICLCIPVQIWDLVVFALIAKAQHQFQPPILHAVV